MSHPSFSSLRRCRSLFNEAVRRRKKIAARAPTASTQRYDAALIALEEALAKKDLEAAQSSAAVLSQFLAEYGRKGLFEHAVDLVLAVAFALVIATLVRQMWFELYEIPTGSMRPTFKEQDRVIVSKDAFGINMPLATHHLLFNEPLLKRGHIVVVTGDGLDLPDVDTTYFLLFPGKKRYVKRLLGKGGDHLYFYGGKIWGVDRNGEPLFELIDELDDKDHIPFISFEGKSHTEYSGANKVVTFRQMNLPLAQVTLSPTGATNGSIMTPQSWAPESPSSQDPYPHTLSQFWGIGNYAMVRLLEPYQLPARAKDLGYDDDNAIAYLELRHSPSVGRNSGSYRYESALRSSSRSLIQTQLTWIPLSAEHCEKIGRYLYTDRFFVRDGVAQHYSENGPTLGAHHVMLWKGIPDGCYEFFGGKAYAIGFGGTSSLLDPSHPIYPKTIPELKTLYNSGIEFSSLTSAPSPHFPSRYGYFRDGAFYLMGRPVFWPLDDYLTDFEQREVARQKSDPQYAPFIDQGPPITRDGSFDVAFIRNYGLAIPEGQYLLLGDNHAMSADSRFFGFVQEAQIQGSPVAIFWPFGERWGFVTQPHLPWWRTPHCLILVIVGVVALGSTFVVRKRRAAILAQVKKR